MRRSVEVKNAPTVMLDDEESIEHPKCQRRNGKEIEGRHDLTVVFEKGQPTLRLLEIGAQRQTPQMPGDCRLGNIEAELQQFAMDARRAPIGVVGFHAPNQRSDFLADFGPADPAGVEAPEQSEAGAAPGNDGFGLHDNERSRPAASHTPECQPEEPVNLAQSGAGLCPFEDDELLAKSGSLQPELVARNEVRANIGESRENEPDHQSDVMQNGVARCLANSSFSYHTRGFDDRQPKSGAVLRVRPMGGEDVQVKLPQTLLVLSIFAPLGGPALAGA